MVIRVGCLLRAVLFPPQDTMSALSSSGSACCSATAREISEMLQMIQQDVFIGIILYGLTEWTEVCTEQWKDLAGC